MIMQRCFENSYARTQWQELLAQTFDLKAFENPQEIPLSTEAERTVAKEVYQLGTIQLSDQKIIGVFEVQIQPNTQLHRNRVQLRNLIAKQMVSEGAFAVYYDAQNPQKWRFSFISIEGDFDDDGQFIQKETACKRYTYLLGEDEKIKTAVSQFSQLNQTSNLEDVINAFAVEPLNKEFYNKLYTWYEKAQKQVIFPNDENQENHCQTSLIRLLTRLLFVWFLKQKNLVNADFFEKEKLQNLIHWDKESSYYKAILQNLFFATLNREISSDKNKNRSFRTTDKNGKPNSNSYGVTTVYRYKNYFKNTNEESILQLFEKTPFLNGGLFDCLDREAEDEEINALEQGKALRNERLKIRIEGFSDRSQNTLCFPNKLFFNKEETDLGLINLLEQYQFTVDESTTNDIEIALDPELLGKVFENLLASFNPETGEQARKSTGSFYTPREIVSYMVNESLKQHFLSHTQISENNINNLFTETDDNPLSEEETQELIACIDNLKIIDPAVGSGAFPMGILQRLTLILEKIDPHNKYWKQRQLEIANTIPDENSKQASINSIETIFSVENKYNAYGHKLFLIEKAIYGVDIQPIAIQICKLRFFISLTIEQTPNDDKFDNYGIKALPNLETKFIVTNALLSLSEPSKKTERSMNNQNLENLADLRKELQKVRERHFRAKTAITKKRCRNEDQEIRKKIKSVLKQSAFADKRSEAEADRIANWDPYQPDIPADWFDAKWQFGIKDGFDIVIGNPPYIQLQKDSGKLGDLYKGQKYQSFARTGDIYSLFYERGHQLLSKKGHLCLITSNKWMRAGYGKALRGYLIKHTQPIKLLDLGPDIFESATVDTNILLFAKQPQQQAMQALTIQGKEQGQQLDKLPLSELPLPNAEESWIILNKAEFAIKQKIEQIGTPLKDWDIEINYGIKTGYNNAFIIDTDKKNELVGRDANSDKIFKRILRGKDIKRYSSQWAGLWLINIHNGYKDEESKEIFPAIKIDDYPVIKEHLDRHWDTIEIRQDKGQTPYHLRNCAYYEAFTKEKIVWGEIVQNAEFFYDNNGYYLEASSFILTGENIKYLNAFLNSKPSHYFFKTFYAGGGLSEKGIRYKKAFMQNIPIPKISEISEQAQQAFITLVEQILQAKKNNPEVDTSHWETKIDQLVYQLYQLTLEEIDIIEKT